MGVLALILSGTFFSEKYLHDRVYRCHDHFELIGRLDDGRKVLKLVRDDCYWDEPVSEESVADQRERNVASRDD